MIKLHVGGTAVSGGKRTSFLQDLAGHSVCAKNDCQTLHLANSAGDDDDGSTSASGPLVAASNLPGDLWQTPFDVDFDANKTVLWGKDYDGPGSPVLVKIILEDKSLHFYAPNGSPTNKKGEMDSEWAIVPGGANVGMFVCRGPIVVASDPSHFDYVTVKVLRLPPSSDKKGVYGGLNIGIIAEDGKLPGGQPSYIPIYLDPNFKSNGVQ